MRDFEDQLSDIILESKVKTIKDLRTNRSYIKKMSGSRAIQAIDLMFKSIIDYLEEKEKKWK